MLQNLSITRYPPTANRSLRAWNAGDEYVLKYLTEIGIEGSPAIYNDRFGYLSCALAPYQPTAVIDYKSSEKALLQNIQNNGLDGGNITRITSLDPHPRPVDIGIIKIPKSLDLFRFYLGHACSALKDSGSVICSFMTRHFSPGMIAAAEEYFEIAEQSLARKKSRLLILRKKKDGVKMTGLHSFSHTFSTGQTENLKQFPGGFSAGKIDPATQFLLENTQIQAGEIKILDLASGNGVIARDLQLRNSEAEIHLLDDFILAVESSMQNIGGKQVHFHQNDILEDFKPSSFDLVISNPPFHLGHENNIEIALSLFQQTETVLKETGRFLCVANLHLNYRTHLKKIFNETRVVTGNEKFVIYECIKK